MAQGRQRSTKGSNSNVAKNTSFNKGMRRVVQTVEMSTAPQTDGKKYFP